MKTRSKALKPLLCAALLLVLSACGLSEKKPETIFLEDIRPREMGVIPNNLDYYDELNDGLMTLLDEGINSREDYSYRIYLTSRYRSEADGIDTRYNWSVECSVEIMNTEGLVKIEKKRESMQETKSEITYVDSPTSPTGKMTIYECISDTILYKIDYSDHVYYIDIGETTVDIYSPVKNEWTSYSQDGLVQAFSDALFPEDTGIFEGEDVAALKSPSDSHSLVKHINTEHWYRPLFLMADEDPPEIPLTTIIFRFGTEYQSSYGIKELHFLDTNFHGIIYPLVTGEEFPLTYEDVPYRSGGVRIDRFESASGFELPD